MFAYNQTEAHGLSFFKPNLPPALVSNAFNALLFEASAKLPPLRPRCHNLPHPPNQTTHRFHPECTTIGPSPHPLLTAMNTLCLRLVLPLLVALPLAGWAEDLPLSKTYSQCMEKSDGVTAAMVECITAEYKRQDAHLNQAYKALAKDLSAARKKQLQEVQRAWLKFRDANCAFYDDPDGGTLARVLSNECMMTLTAQRAKELEALAQP